MGCHLTAGLHASLAQVWNLKSEYLNTKTQGSVCHLLTWWCHHCAPGRTSGCVLGDCRPRPPQPQSTPPLFPPCSTGCYGTGDLCSHGSTPASADSVALSCPPCSFQGPENNGVSDVYAWWVRWDVREWQDVYTWRDVRSFAVVLVSISPVWSVAVLC